MQLPFPEILNRVKLVTAAHLAEANGIDARPLWFWINDSDENPTASVTDALRVLDELREADTKRTRLDDPNRRQWIDELYDMMAALERDEAKTVDTPERAAHQN